MFDIYDTVNGEDGKVSYAKITHQPISYNKLLQLLEGVELPIARLSSLPLGEQIDIDSFKIVRVI